MMWRTLPFVLLVACATATGNAQTQPAQARDDQMMFLPLPYDFTAADSDELKRTVDTLRSHAEKLFASELQTPAQQALENESKVLIEKLGYLTDKKQLWEEYQAAIQARPQLRQEVGGIGPVTEDPLPIARMLRLFHRFDYMDRQRLIPVFRPWRPAEDVQRPPPPPWSSSRPWRPAENTDPVLPSETRSQPLGDDAAAALQWELLAGDFRSFHGYRFALDNGNARYILRAYLLQGKAYLQASELYWKNKRLAEQLKTYELGIRALRRVIDLTETAALIGKGAEVDSLPADLEKLVPRQPDPGELDYVACLRAGLYDNRSATSAEARATLAAVCPWGTELYSFLKQNQLIQGFDFSILRPFYQADMIEQPPKLWVSALREELVPPHIVNDMKTIVGDKRTGHSPPVGKTTDPLEWGALTPPTYTIWYYSPSVYELKPSELLWWSAHVRKMICGWDLSKPYFGKRGYLIDLGLFAEQKAVDWGLPNATNIRFANKLLVEARSAGLDEDLLFDYAEKGFNFTRLAQWVGTKAFEASEEYELKVLFDSIDPSNHGLGRGVSYDGSRIPPILISAEVFGMDRVKDFEYRRTRRIVRYYMLDPRALSGTTGEYDLSPTLRQQRTLRDRPYVLTNAAVYHSGNDQVRAKTWPLLPNQPKPLGCREYATDFTPLCQIIRINFEPAFFETWKKEAGGKPIEVMFHDGQQRHFATATLNSPYLAVQLAHKAYLADGYSPATTKASGIANFGLAASYGSIRGSLPPSAIVTLAPGTLPCDLSGPRAMLPLTTSYTVRIVCSGRELGSFPIRFVATRTEPVTPGIEWPSADTCIVTCEYPPSANRVIPLTPNDKDLLATRLFLVIDAIEGSWKAVEGSQTQVYEVADNVRDAKLTAQLGGSELKPGYVRCTVQVGDQTYFMWGKVRSLGASIQMLCDIPIPPGQTTIVAKAAGVEASLTMRRRPPARPPAGNEQTLMQVYEKARQAHAQDPSNQGALANYLLACHRAAVGYASIELYRQANALCLDIDKLAPNYDRFDDIDLWKVQYESGFRIGDKASMLQGGQRYIEHLYGEDARRSFRTSGRTPGLSSNATSASRMYGQLLRRWVSVGGEANVAEAIYQTRVQFWAMAGYEGVLDMTLNDLAFDFGPAQGGQ